MGDFASELTITGPWRSPVQMLQEQAGGKGATVHDGDTAADMGLAGAPIEGCTHFSQFDPLAVAKLDPHVDATVAIRVSLLRDDLVFLVENSEIENTVGVRIALLAH